MKYSKLGVSVDVGKLHFFAVTPDEVISKQKVIEATKKALVTYWEERKQSPQSWSYREANNVFNMEINPNYYSSLRKYVKNNEKDVPPDNTGRKVNQ